MCYDFHLAKSYKEVCTLLHGLKQIIETFTRITEKTSTIIDHILTNSVDLRYHCLTITQYIAQGNPENTSF